MDERGIAELAARQHGVVTLAQMGAFGLGPRGAQERARRGRLHRLHRGVYAVGHPALSPDGRRSAAVLACGPGAALSHRSAAVVWGIRRADEVRLDVSTPRRGRRPPRGVRLHRVRAPFEVAEVRGLAVTTVARTLLDLAEVLAPPALARAVHEAERLRLLDARAVEAEVGGANGRRGTRALARALAVPDPGPTRSVLEERFDDLVARAGLPRPRRNVHVDTPDRLVEVDVLWPRERVVVELDGGPHRTRRAFESDRARDTALAAEGYVVVRLTWRRLKDEAGAVAGQLRRLLAVRGG